VILHLGSHQRLFILYLPRREVTAAMSSRRERRAQDTSIPTNDIALQHPAPRSRTGNAPTLLEQAKARGALPSTQSQPCHNNIPDNLSAEAAPAPSHTAALLTTILYASTLTLLHYTFRVLVLHQYSQLGADLTSPPTSSSPTARILLVILKQIVQRYLLVYTGLVYISHTPILPFPHFPRFRQAVFLLVATFAGCMLVRMTHRAPYLQMVERAPAVGSIWIWSTLELGVEAAIVMGVIVASYAWWNGYGLS
jgi:hypothetical protein